MELKFEDLIERPEILDTISTQCNLKLEYDIFKSNINLIIYFLGNDAKCVFTEKSAYIVFKKYTNLLVIIHKDDGFNKEELFFENLNMSLTGTNKRKLPNFFSRLYQDIIDNKTIISFFLILLIVIFKVINYNNESLKNLNDALINVISIFIGTLFVFITLFYEDEKKISIMLEKENFDTNSENDKYIFNISLISLVCVLISNSLMNIQNDNIILCNIKEYIKANFTTLYSLIKDNISFVFTAMSIVLLVICFTSITGYYLKKIKSSAINKKILSFKEDYDKENLNVP